MFPLASNGNVANESSSLKWFLEHYHRMTIIDVNSNSPCCKFIYMLDQYTYSQGPKIWVEWNYVWRLEYQVEMSPKHSNRPWDLIVILHEWLCRKKVNYNFNLQWMVDLRIHKELLLWREEPGRTMKTRWLFCNVGVRVYRLRSSKA